MILERQPPPFVARSIEVFKAALAARGAQRGLTAAKASDAEGSLFIYDAIGEDFWTGAGITATGIAEKLEELKGVKTLRVFINSPGGSVWEGKTIYNQLARFGAKKIVHIDGIAASAASLIAMAGERIITEPGGTWLIHRVAGGAHGFSEDLRHVADEIDAETASITGIYEKRTGQSRADLEKWMREDTICDAVTAKARGLTDEISEADQRRADECAAIAARTAAPVALSPQTLVAQARAARSAIHEQFPGASPGQPGQPGTTTAAPGNRQKEHAS